MSNSAPNASTPPLLLTKEQLCELPVKGSHLYLLVLLIFVMIITFVGNLLVILAVIFFRRLRSVTNYFIFSLAVSDILISLIPLPLRIDQNSHNGHWCLSLTACQIWISIDSICSLSSVWNLAIISIDRFIAIKHPFRYHSLITKKVCIIMITSVWIYSVFLTGLSFINWTDPGKQSFSVKGECSNTDPIYYTVVISLSFFTPLLVVLVMYGIVFQVALNQTRAIQALQVNSARNGRRSSVNLILEVKAAKTLAIVIGCFITCWLPFNVIFFIALWQPKLIFSLSKETRVGLSMTFIYVLPALNSTMNPVIYTLFNRDIRSAFVSLFRRVTGKGLGAVGLGGPLDPPSSTARDENMMTSRVVQFKDNHDSPSPKNCNLNLQSYSNPGYSDQAPFDRNLNFSNDTQSMITTLDDDKRSQMDDTTAPAQNGHVTDDITKRENDVLQRNMNVIEKDTGDSPNMVMSVKLPPLETNPVVSPENDCLPAEKLSILPPIEGNNLVRDSEDDVQTQVGNNEGYNTAL